MFQVSFGHGQDSFGRSGKNVVVLSEVLRVRHWPRKLLTHSDLGDTPGYFCQIAFCDLSFQDTLNGILDPNRTNFNLGGISARFG